MSQTNIPRFRDAQTERTFLHPLLPQSRADSSPVGGSDSSSPDESNSYRFAIAADTQLGMLKHNADWEAEKEYSRQAVEYLNQLNATERPLFCCVCGDLVHMTSEIYGTKTPNNNDNDKEEEKEGLANKKWTREECDAIQDQQFADFQSIWSKLHPDIALLCACGNHDVGNRPTRASIQRFCSVFGDDYLAFWVKLSYHIVLNTSLFSDPSEVSDLYEEQLVWLEERLRYATKQKAQHIFVFGHHPWFLYDEDEDETKMTTYSPLPMELGLGGKAPDAYFVIPRATRRKALELFQTYKVTAAFAGHFHQNWVTQTSFGMKLIVTSSLSVVLESNGIPQDFAEPKNTRGLRMVQVHGGEGSSFQHDFVSL